MTSRSLLLYALYGVLLYFIQASILKTFLPAIPTPSLFVPLIVALAFYEVSTRGALFAVMLGVELDLLAGTQLGPSAAAFVAIYGVLSCCGQRIFIESAPALLVTSFVSSLIGNTILSLFLYRHTAALSEQLFIIIIEALGTALLAPLVFFVARRIILQRSDRFDRRRGLI
jgi:rod shape-determining protein MreD